MAGYAAGNRYRDGTLSSMLDDVARRHATREALVFLASGERLELSERDRVLHTLPFSGTWGDLVIPLMPWSRGGRP